MSDQQQPFRGYQPYESETDSDVETDSDSTGSESESSGTTPAQRVAHDGRMEALDSWRSAAQSWIAGPGRQAGPTGQLLRPLPLSAAVPPPGGRPAGAPRAGAVDLPLDLRANDIRRYIINIDSQFRENPQGSSAGDFWFHLVAPIRNVLRVRVASVELPNNYKFFTLSRKFTTLSFVKGGLMITITIPDGNYKVSDMITALTMNFTASPDLSGMTVDFSEVTGQFTFCAPYAFSIDTTVGTHARPFNYGLGWYLGFTRGVHVATDTPGGIVRYCVSSDGCADFAGDNYLLMKVNDFDCITQTVAIYQEGLPAQENAITALAKLVLREPKNYVAFDDNSSQHIKEVVFQNPRDLYRFHVQLMDDFGEPIDMCTAQFSFSLEVLEVLNPSLFDAVRDSMTLRYV
jgi:hypothetical protein